MREFILAISILLLLLTGCSKEERWEPEVVARIGDQKLTSSEVTAWEASLRQAEIPQEVRSAFIHHWVEEELLYQTALERDLTEDPWVTQRIDELTRSLLTSRLLELEYLKIKQPSTTAITTYFQQHSSEFTWPHVHLDVDYWRSQERRAMERLRSNIQRGRQVGIWTGQSGSLESGRIELDGPGSTDPEVWSIVSHMKIGQVSQVRFLNDEYWVFKLIDRREAGEPQGLDDVHDEIMMRLMEQARRQLRDELIRKLIEENRRSGRLYWSTQPRQMQTMDTLSKAQENLE